MRSNQKDVLFENSTIEFKNPGVFTRGGGPEQTSTLHLAAVDGYWKKEILIKNTAVKFLDWTDAPQGRYTTTTNVGGKLTTSAAS